jgi:ATP-dependent Clp protease ATP-binding subunit ClpX
MDNIELMIEDKALDRIVDKAAEADLGARALRGIIEKLFCDIMFESPSMKNLERLIITDEMIAGTGQPRYEFKQESKKATIKKGA